MEGRGEYDEALKLVQGVWGQFPERRFDLSRELLYLYRKTEQYERCLTVWEKGHRQGFFYMIIPTMKQYEPFAGFDKFAAIAEEDKRLREAALEKSQTIFEVVLPQGYSEKETYPLLIVLHGGGSNIERAKKHWHSPLLGEKYIVVFIRSYLHYDSETFGWKVFDPRAREDIRRCFDEIAAQYPVDTARVIIGGISAGGTAAIDMTFNQVIPVAGFIGVCPGKPREFDAERAGQAKAAGIKGVIISGETDRYRPRQEAMVEIFRQIEFPHRFDIIEGMGHEYPEDLSRRLDEALTYLAG